MALSAQYYGDATLWRTIGAANGLSDPQPLGNYQLLIPPPSS
jgi:nucleoid-associated protein YgaU